MLQAGDEEPGSGLPSLRFAFQSLFSERPILIQQFRQLQLRCVIREAVDVYLHDGALRKTADDFTDVVLETAVLDIFAG